MGRRRPRSGSRPTGSSDRCGSLILDVVEFALAGDAPRALASVRRIRDAGGDPSLALKDMLELVHFVSVAAVAPQQATDPSVPEAERTRGMAMAKRAGLNGAQAAWAQMPVRGHRPPGSRTDRHP